MRRQPTYLLAVLTLSLSVGIRAADPREADVRMAQQAFGHCWEAHDADCMNKVLTGDFDFIARNNAAMDRQQFLGMVKAGNISATFNVPASAQVRFYGPVALVTFVAGGPRAAKITLVWSNADGNGWKLARGHVSPDPVSK